MKLSNEFYNGLKWLAQIGLPALATLYFAMAALWGWPDAEKVIGSLTALDGALGAMLQVSTRNFVKNNTLVLMPRKDVPVAANPQSPSEE